MRVLHVEGRLCERVRGENHVDVVGARADRLAQRGHRAQAAVRPQISGDRGGGQHHRKRRRGDHPLRQIGGLLVRDERFTGAERHRDDAEAATGRAHCRRIEARANPPVERCGVIHRRLEE